jgi:DNA-binding NarL/FixJ family response regulator
VQRRPANGAVVVVGPDDLMTTSVVSALRANGLAARRSAVGRLPADPAPAAGILVVDLDARGSLGVVATATRAGWSVLVVSAATLTGSVAAAIAAGAKAWISKTSTVDVLVNTVLELSAGVAVMEAAERAEWLAVHRQTSEAAEFRLRRFRLLTEREREVLGLIADGRRAAEIAESLVVAMSTVRTHIRSILRKLEVNSQEAAVAVHGDVMRYAADRRPGRPGVM